MARLPRFEKALEGRLRFGMRGRVTNASQPESIVDPAVCRASIDTHGKERMGGEISAESGQESRAIFRTKDEVQGVVAAPQEVSSEGPSPEFVDVVLE